MRSVKLHYIRQFHRSKELAPIRIHKNTRATSVTLVFLVRRKGFSAAAAAIASLRSLPTAAKTAHRAVFFRMLRILPPCSNPFLCAVIIKSLRQQKLPEAFGTPEGIRRLLRLRLAYGWLADRNARHFSTRLTAFC